MTKQQLIEKIISLCMQESEDADSLIERIRTAQASVPKFDDKGGVK